MMLLTTVTLSLVAAAAFMSAMFMAGHRLKRYDVVDVAWGLTFIVISLVSLAANRANLTSIVLCCIVAIWGVRLSAHIYRRFRAAPHEDKRYVELRKRWRSSNLAATIYGRIYLVQAVLATIVCLPVLVIHAAQMDVQSMYLWSGLLVWLAGFTIEAVGDHQLQSFLRNPQHKGSLMTSGLWKYSRHPNYFGELVQWWGIGVIALGVPFGWIGLIGPVMISYLIIFVSGVPPVERAFKGRPGWAEYKAQTSTLIPLPARKSRR